MINTGTIIRDYKIIEKIGEGGMGTVYLAEDTMLERRVALKVLNPLLTVDPQFIERFRIEAKVQGSLIHPNLVAMHSFFTQDNHYFMVMEFANGRNLKEVLLNRGKFEHEKALSIFKQILAGVGFAHQMGIVHRDLKPSNIIVDDYGNVKIMDFGIAKIMGDRQLTKTGTKMGTLYYMSPEQVRGLKDIDQKSDIYSLGIVLYEMLTGTVPINIDTESELDIMNFIVSGVFKGEVINNSPINISLARIILKMTAPNKEERHSTCYQIQQDIDTIPANSIGSNFNKTHKELENRNAQLGSNFFGDETVIESPKPVSHQKKDPEPKKAVKVEPLPPIEYKGVGGWLLFYAIINLVISPIFYFLEFSENIYLLDFADIIPGLSTLLKFDSFAMIALGIYGIVVGVLILKKHPNVPEIAKLNLKINFGVVLILNILLGVLTEFGVIIFIAVILNVIYFLIWHTYFKKSKRIKDTFGTGSQLIPIV